MGAMRILRRRRAARPRWVAPEPGMTTGTVDGQVIGHVVAARDGFIAFDATQSPVGRFSTLPAAQRAAEAAAA